MRVAVERFTYRDCIVGVDSERHRLNVVDPTDTETAVRPFYFQRDASTNEWLGVKFPPVGGAVYLPKAFVQQVVVWLTLEGYVEAGIRQRQQQTFMSGGGGASRHVAKAAALGLMYGQGAGVSGGGGGHAKIKGRETVVVTWDEMSAVSMGGWKP